MCVGGCRSVSRWYDSSFSMRTLNLDIMDQCSEFIFLTQKKHFSRFMYHISFAFPASKVKCACVCVNVGRHSSATATWTEQRSGTSILERLAYPHFPCSICVEFKNYLEIFIHLIGSRLLTWKYLCLSGLVAVWAPFSNRYWSIHLLSAQCLIALTPHRKAYV